MAHGTGAAVDNSIAAVENRRALREVERDLHSYFTGLAEDQQATYRPVPPPTPMLAHLTSMGSREVGERAELMRKAAQQSPTYPALLASMNPRRKKERSKDEIAALRERREKKLSSLALSGLRTTSELSRSKKK